MQTLTVHKNDAGQRLDRFLTKATHALPQSLMYKYLRTKRIKLNGKKAQPNTVLAENDEITLYIPDEFFDAGGASRKSARLSSPALTLRPEEIVYEDENLLLIDKPQGELVHADLPDEPSASPDARRNGAEACLVDRMCGYLYKKGEYDPARENAFAPALCNRLDRNTCGIVIAAKTAQALAVLNQKIRDRELEKKYLCMVYGVPAKKSATLKDFLYKDKRANRVYIFPTPEQAKKAFSLRYDDDIKTVITKYTVLKTSGDRSLLEVELITGRTHQIRAHLAYIGHPIVGDGKYGVNHKSRTGKQYQMLCSYYLKFCFRTDAGALAYLDGREFYSHYDLNSTK
ncbi:MAG: pseudouridine synthase [Eubacteriales bacterium]